MNKVIIASLLRQLLAMFRPPGDSLIDPVWAEFSALVNATDQIMLDKITVAIQIRFLLKTFVR